MNNTQVFAVTVIALGLFGLYLESQCKTGIFVQTIMSIPNFGEYVLALIVFLIILSLIGEPYSSYLAGITVVALLYVDYERNGPNGNIWSVLTNSTSTVAAPTTTASPVTGVNPAGFNSTYTPIGTIGK